MDRETDIVDLVSGRYETWHQAGNVKFFLSDYIPDPEECKFLLLKVVEQSVRDFVSLADSIEPELRETCKEARDFIFDDEYYIDWGDKQLNLPMILELLEIDTEWFRDKARKKLLEKDEL
jgi:hypothetical protein